MTTDTLSSGFIADQPETNWLDRRAETVRDRPFSAEAGAISLGRESPDVDELTYVVLQDSCLLIDHLSGRNDHSIAALELDCIETDEKGESRPKKVNLIDEVCSIRSSIAGRAEFSKHAATLFKARDKLSVLAAPATCLTIAYTLLVAPGGNGRADFARKAYPTLMRHAKGFRTWITWLPVWMLFVVLLASVVSWYVAYGKLLLSRIEQLDGQRSEISTALDTAEGSGAAIVQAAARGAAAEAWQQDERHLLIRCAGRSDLPQDARWNRACAAAEQLEQKRIAADAALNEWTSYWLWLPRSAAGILGANPTEGAGKGGMDEREEQWSANLVAVLGNYVLPMMYGFLGAAAAVMLNINQKIRSCRLKPRDHRMSCVQLVLGVITGACIGLFLTPSGTGTPGAPLSGSSVALSASALSFLAGFGVEGVFKMIQNILTTVFGEQPHAPTPHPHA